MRLQAFVQAGKNKGRSLVLEKKGTETLGKILQNEPQKLPYKKEKKGEAFAWQIDGEGYYNMG